MAVDDPDASASPLDEEARAWVRRIRSGEATGRDARLLRQWCARSTQHSEAFARARQEWHDIGGIAAAYQRLYPASSSMPHRAATKAAALPDPRRRWMLSTGLSAAGAAVVVAAIHPPLALWPSWSELAADYRTGTGQQARVLDWMRLRFGYAGDATGALVAFLALPEEQQGVLVREVYFEELRQSGREYNDAGSRRAGSYLRGRNATALLLPRRDAQGQAIDYRGDIKFQEKAGVHTDFGGGIQVLAPGGGLTLGANGVLPPPSTGLLTQGKGDIEIYTRDSVLLGLSRIFTTFGGGIVIWSAEGDINAGRGTKTTVVYTPPKREYDMLGNIKLSPNVPSTGAGIATLAPIAEVPAGDVDLIAPLGTIDAGEAGIRVSGNVNLAALHVVNATNIQVKGESSGLPVVAAVNVGALTNASAAASQATSAAAQDVMQRERNAARQALPSIFTVRVLGFGNEPLPGTGNGGTDGGAPRGGNNNNVDYRKGSAVQVLGDAAMGASERNQLTPAERRSLGF